MPRRSLLSETERASLLVLPASQDDLVQQYSFTDTDMAVIRQHRGGANRFGFAVQLCFLRYPGYALASNTKLPGLVIDWIAKQVGADVATWPEYGGREKTRNKHLHELRADLGLSVFGLADFRNLVRNLGDLAMQTDKAMVLAAHSPDTLRERRIIVPALTVIERACAEAVTRANRRIYGPFQTRADTRMMPFLSVRIFMQQAFLLNGEKFELSHLDDFSSYTDALLGNTTKRVRVEGSYSCHCWSRLPVKGEDILPERLVLDGSKVTPRNRIFCEQRYEMSKALPLAITQMLAGEGHISNTQEQNILRVDKAISSSGRQHHHPLLHFSSH